MTRFGLLAISGGLVFAAALDAQGGLSVWDGVYSAEQAARGAQIYAARCASCHGAGLEGVESAPALTGDLFNGNWTGTTLAELADRIRVSMPLNQPGTLSRQQVADVIANILSAGKFPAGMSALEPQEASLSRIRFVSPKP